VDVRGRDCLDVGASTGGFTDCLLQNGAERVLAVDVGTAQLHEKVRNDPRVTSRENTHVLQLTKSDVGETFSGRGSRVAGHAPLVVVDVSFISLEKVLPHLGTLAPEGTEFLALVKPQFEVGPKQAPKGVVRDPKVREAVVSRLAAKLPEWGFEPAGSVASDLKGPKGNQESFIRFFKRGRRA
jgi:23S rRNA (cytidine1920-2'-O)/16S rRNA (cytidine1409-2'-O)-methyltransferase